MRLEQVRELLDKEEIPYTVEYFFSNFHGTLQIIWLISAPTSLTRTALH